MADDNTRKEVATALIAGALLGAGIALLFAPQSGRKTRRKIRYLAENAGSRAHAVQRELWHSVENIKGDVEERLQAGLADGVQWTDGKLEELRQALAAARKTIGEQVEKIQAG
ncbi:MAG: YtxH domain-containing protein [Acidobacteria bacterium]|nr:YtxH domain-containing protein [Acidobacteriota bacterium]